MKNLLIILVLLLSSCYTAGKAGRQMDKAHAKQEIVAASKCAIWYPVKEHTITETKFIKGKDSIITDTLFVDCTEPKNVGQKIVKVPSIREVYRVDTFIKTVTKQVENTAKIQALNLQNVALQVNVTALEAKNRKLRKQATIYLIGLGIATIFFIFKFIK